MENLGPVGSKNAFHFEFSLYKVDEEADILLLQAGDVVGPVDDPVEDSMLGEQPDHPAQLGSVLEVGVQLKLRPDLTETWHLEKLCDANPRQRLIFTLADIFVTDSRFSQSLAFSQSSPMVFFLLESYQTTLCAPAAVGAMETTIAVIVVAGRADSAVDRRHSFPPASYGEYSDQMYVRYFLVG